MPDDSHRLALSSAMGGGGRSLSVEPPNRRRRGAPCPAPAALATVEAGRFEAGWFETGKGEAGWFEAGRFEACEGLEAGKVEAGRFEASEGLEAGGAAGAGRLAPLGALVGNGVGGRSLSVEPPNRRRRGAPCPAPAALRTVGTGYGSQLGWRWGEAGVACPGEEEVGGEVRGMGAGWVILLRGLQSR